MNVLTHNPNNINNRVDPDLARLAIALKHDAEFRLWILARRDSGVCRIDELYTVAGYTPQHFNRTLKAGEGIFWTYDKQRRRLFVRSIRKVARDLTQLAYDTNQPQLVDTNAAGVRPVYIDTSAAGAAFKREVFAAWLTYRKAPTIAVSTLAKLFNVDPRTVQRWRGELVQSAKMTTRYNYAVMNADYALNRDKPPIRGENLPPSVLDNAENNPALVQEYKAIGATGNPSSRLSWQMSNTYIPNQYRQHNRKGQARKVRKIANAVRDNNAPTRNRRGGQRKAYYHDEKRYQRMKSDKRPKGYVFVFRGVKTSRNTIERNLWEYRCTVSAMVDTDEKIYREHFCHPHNTYYKTGVPLVCSDTSPVLLQDPPQNTLQPALSERYQRGWLVDNYRAGNALSLEQRAAIEREYRQAIAEVQRLPAVQKLRRYTALASEYNATVKKCEVRK